MHNMKYLKLDEKLADKLRKSQKTVIFMDYDGTLNNIVVKPEQAILLNKVKNLLEEISEYNEIIIGIVTGRSLKTIKKLVNLKGIIYVGNHGFEMELPARKDIKNRFKFKGKFNNTKIKALMKKIADDINKMTKNIENVYLEDKELTLSLHWRDVKNRNLKEIKKVVAYIINTYHLKASFIKGKKVMNICPSIDWDKGKAIKFLLANCILHKKNNFVAFLGDDKTDEFVFKIFKNNQIPIRVGKKRNSAAKFYLNNPDEVYRFLKFILIINRKNTKN